MGPDREADGAAQVKCLLINSQEPPHNKPPKSKRISSHHFHVGLKQVDAVASDSEGEVA